MYQNPWFEVIEDDVIRPDGEPGMYATIRTKSGVGTVVVDDEQQVVLVAQFRYAPQVFSLEIIKGAFDGFGSEETAREAASRELLEETGITARHWQPLTDVHTLMGYSSDHVQLFLATELTLGDSSPDGDEDLVIIRHPLNDIDTIIHQGIDIEGTLVRMTDATSIAGLLLAKTILC